MPEQHSFVRYFAYDWMEMEKYSGQVQKLTKLTLNPKSIFHQWGREGGREEMEVRNLPRKTLLCSSLQAFYSWGPTYWGLIGLNFRNIIFYGSGNCLKQLFSVRVIKLSPSSAFHIAFFTQALSLWYGHCKWYCFGFSRILSLSSSGPQASPPSHNFTLPFFWPF